MNEELKPCPFCGEKAILADDKIAYCSGRGCIVSFITKEQWQSRPLEDALKEEISKMMDTVHSLDEVIGIRNKECDALRAKLEQAKEALDNIKFEVRFRNNTDLEYIVELVEETIRKLEEN